MAWSHCQRMYCQGRRDIRCKDCHASDTNQDPDDGENASEDRLWNFVTIPVVDKIYSKNDFQALIPHFFYTFTQKRTMHISKTGLLESSISFGRNLR